MFQFEKKISSKLDCRKHYTEHRFTQVFITYSHENGLYIQAYKGKDKQELFIPERYVVCIGVDYEPEQPE